jgi:hypothetical protein
MIGHSYKIAAIPSTLRWEESASGSSEGAGTLYHIDLAGRVDRNWHKTFYLVQWDSLENFTYQLREDGKGIWFHCKPGEGPDRAELLLRGLMALVKIVNASASRKPEEFILPSGLMQGGELAHA